MTSDNKFDWMRETVYEPRPMLTPAHPTPIPLGWRVFIILGMIACVCGALAALAV
jgi:hypothetical protein